MNPVLPIPRSRASSSHRRWAGLLGGLIFSAAFSGVGAEVGRRVGRRSAPWLQKQLLDVSRRVQTFGERLTEQAAAPREDQLTEQAATIPADLPAATRGSVWDYLVGALGGVLVNAGQKFGAIAAKEAGFGAAAVDIGENIGILVGLGVAAGIVAVATVLEGETSEPSPPPPPTGQGPVDAGSDPNPDEPTDAGVPGGVPGGTDGPNDGGDAGDSRRDPSGRPPDVKEMPGVPQGH